MGGISTKDSGTPTTRPRTGYPVQSLGAGTGIAGQVRSECLTCAFRASCCSARLSRAPLSGTGKKGEGVLGGGAPALAGTMEYKQSDRGL